MASSGGREGTPHLTGAVARRRRRASARDLSAGCARRMPVENPKDAGSIPAASKSARASGFERCWRRRQAHHSRIPRSGEHLDAVEAVELGEAAAVRTHECRHGGGAALLEDEQQTPASSPLGVPSAVGTDIPR